MNPSTHARCAVAGRLDYESYELEAMFVNVGLEIINTDRIADRQLILCKKFADALIRFDHNEHIGSCPRL